MPDSTIPARVEALLREMTLAEKLAMTQGTLDPAPLGQAGYLAGVPRLGIPPLRLADGPQGINVAADATALPAPIALAATFDPELAVRYGAVLGEEARALGQQVVLAPHINIARVPEWDRVPTTLGEDPLLAARLGAAQVEGIQSAGVMAQPKHFVANNQGLHQHGPGQPEGKDFVVDERTLREIYTPAFEACARADAASVMIAYNRINGAFNTENADTLTGLLREELGFRGFTVSDWGANHSVRSFAAGLDIEMPGEIGVPLFPAYFGPALAAEVDAGRLPIEGIDEAMRNILVQMERFGLLDGAETASGDVGGEARFEIAREIATRGAVLLRNDGEALPLRDEALGSIAVIGATGARLAVGAGGERAYGFPERMTSPLAALRMAAPASRIDHAIGDDITGVAIPAEALSWNGRPGLARDGGGTDATIDFIGDRALAAGSYRWTGAITAPTSGRYQLRVQGWGGEARLRIEGAPLLVAAQERDEFVRPWASLIPTADDLDTAEIALDLPAGESRTLHLEVASTRGPIQLRLAWSTPEARAAEIEAAAALASTCATAIVFVRAGAGGAGQGSAGDHPDLALPADQDALVSAVARANPNVIVVVNAGFAVAMPWRDEVRAILQMWYPGQEGGHATADLLLGRADPGGRLPLTFPAARADAGPHAPGHAERYDGQDGDVVYSEGTLVGYRWFDHQRIAPLFPFGHGLSYTRFDYRDFAIEQEDDACIARFLLRNLGERPGVEVAQLYLTAAEDAPVPSAPQALAGFAAVALEPGEERAIAIPVAARAFEFWCPQRGAWTRGGGERRLLLGASSRDIRLSAALPSG